MYAELRTERLLLRPLGGRQIGAVSVALDKTRREGELGWIFDSRWQKRGYALEAASAVRDFAIRELKVKKLIAQCDCRNSDSFRLMQRIGMIPEESVGTRIYPKTGERAGEFTCVLTIADMV